MRFGPQFTALATPFPDHLIKKKPGKSAADYVSHSTVNERALSVVGPHSFLVMQEIRGHAPGISKQNDGTFKYPPRDNAILGCIAQLHVEIDGVAVTIQEVGTENSPAMHTDAENLKNAASDAYKRCWMRIGLGLHLWSGSDFFLLRQLEKDAAEEENDGQIGT